MKIIAHHSGHVQVSDKITGQLVLDIIYNVLMICIQGMLEMINAEFPYFIYQGVV